MQAKVTFHINCRGTDMRLGPKITPGNRNPGAVREGNQTVGSGSPVSPGGTPHSHFIQRAEHSPVFKLSGFIHFYI